MNSDGQTTMSARMPRKIAFSLVVVKKWSITCCAFQSWNCLTRRKSSAIRSLRGKARSRPAVLRLPGQRHQVHHRVVEPVVAVEAVRFVREDLLEPSRAASTAPVLRADGTRGSPGKRCPGRRAPTPPGRRSPARPGRCPPARQARSPPTISGPRSQANPSLRSVAVTPPMWSACSKTSTSHPSRAR